MPADILDPMADEVHRTDLFATPMWTADLTQFHDRLPQMIDTAERVLAESPAPPGELFSQSQAVLQDVDDPAWIEFFRFLAATMERIVGREMPPVYPFERAFLRSWVLRVDDPDQYQHTGTTLNALHSHIPAVLSSVFYLQVPGALVDASTGGTTFKDPNSVNTRAYSRPEFHLAPAPLRLAIFPAWLEHLPERPPAGTVLDVPRIVVSTDLRVELP